MPTISPIKHLLKRHPYRGILKEIAAERGVRPEAIYRSMKSLNPEILEIITAKMREREAVVKRFDVAQSEATT